MPRWQPGSSSYYHGWFSRAENTELHGHVRYIFGKRADQSKGASHLYDQKNGQSRLKKYTPRHNDHFNRHKKDSQTSNRPCHNRTFLRIPQTPKAILYQKHFTHGTKHIFQKPYNKKINLPAGIQYRAPFHRLAIGALQPLFGPGNPFFGMAARVRQKKHSGRPTLQCTAPELGEQALGSPLSSASSRMRIPSAFTFCGQSVPYKNQDLRFFVLCHVCTQNATAEDPPHRRLRASPPAGKLAGSGQRQPLLLLHRHTLGRACASPQYLPFHQLGHAAEGAISSLGNRRAKVRCTLERPCVTLNLPAGRSPCAHISARLS